MNEESRKSALRSYQDRMLNQGWRIRFIPHDDPSKPVFVANWYALAGMTVFCFGFWGLWTGGMGRIRIPGTFCVAALVGGFGFALVSLLLVGRFKRRGWLRINAVCLDREWHCDGESWEFRLLCRFELEGKTYTVTPAPYWRTFISESAVGRFLANAIGEGGACCLRVNPRNPLQTELATGLAEGLLFRR